MIPEESIRSGSISFYEDSDNRLLAEIDAHNLQMEQCRRKKKQTEEIRMAFSILNPLTVCGITAAQAGEVFARPWLGVTLLAVHVILFLVFCLFGDRLWIPAMASGLLAFLDLSFLILLATDLLLCYLYQSKTNALRSEPGYPAFPDIRIRFEHGKAPTL